MEIIIAWLVFAIIVGAIGSNRKIGFGMAFLLSVILSPLIGLLITLFSESNSSVELQKRSLELQEEQKNILSKMNVSKSSESIINELTKLSDLKTSGTITEEEFLSLKSNLLNNSTEESGEESFKRKSFEEAEAKFKRGDITLHEFEITRNNLGFNNVNTNNGDNDKTIAFIGILVLILFFAYMLLH